MSDSVACGFSKRYSAIVAICSSFGIKSIIATIASCLTFKNFKHSNYRVYCFGGYVASVSSFLDYYKYSMELANNAEAREDLLWKNCPEEEKNDLTTEAEHLCAKLSMDKFGHEFLFVTDYGPEKRAFYHMRDENGVPQGYDLIWRGVEITTGAQREHRYEQLKAQADEKGLGEDVKFYLEFFRYGCPPHGGFGLGVDRLTMLLLGIPIKEVMFLFRGPNRLTP